MQYIDTHTHLDGEEFTEDLVQVVQRCKDAGCTKAFIPAIDMKGLPRIMHLCDEYKGWAYPMIGLHPEEINADFIDTLKQMHTMLAANPSKFIAVGEVGLDYYWSRDFYDEQLVAFEEQVKWAVEFRLPLMIHCRKGQAEMVKILRRYENDLIGGVFHCFTGNEQEARELLSFRNFVLGIGGVLTFKKSHLPEVLPATVPLQRIVLETDSPYMAPVPKRGERNDSSYIPYIITKLAEAYGVSEDEICKQTNDNVARLFRV